MVSNLVHRKLGDIAGMVLLLGWSTACSSNAAAPGDAGAAGSAGGVAGTGGAAGANGGSGGTGIAGSSSPEGARAKTRGRLGNCGILSFTGVTTGVSAFGRLIERRPPGLYLDRGSCYGVELQLGPTMSTLLGMIGKIASVE